MSTNRVHIVNVLLTRRCNLACSYCNIVKNYKGMPAEYKRMQDYTNEEISGEQWIEIIQRMVRNNPNVFFIFYGGEPFVFEDLWKIIKYCNENNVFYTVISNNTDMVQDRIRQVYELCGQYRGFTSSVDPVVDQNTQGQIEFSKSEKGKFYITEKSNHGLLRLIEMKQKNWVADAVAEITVMQSTVPYLYNTVRKLSENGIFSSITTLDNPKNSYYDFARVDNMTEMVQKDHRIWDEFQKIKEDKTLLVHMPELLDEVYNMLPSNGDCGLNKDFHNACLDANGKFRLCLRIRGVNTPNLTLDQCINSDGVIQPTLNEAICKDYKDYCLGCNHSCMKMSQLFSDQIIDHGPQNR